MTDVVTQRDNELSRELVRRGELTDEHRHLVTKLLDEIGSWVRVAAECVRKYPNAPAVQDIAARAVWTPVGAEYSRLLDVVTRAAAGLPGERSSATLQ